ncbi:MAG: pyridoxal phosphate-dependent aminotransferase [Proteobacteria bacterium]|nr:pyridoxal phosphate-dependent aminotransferase [Pseudomonadota bacterium]NOG60929.1 pyridoxal phosphate-dependent aminotransferase [Pseudomonadota bacterium]
MRNKPYTASQRISTIQSPIIPIVSDLINKTPGTISLGQGVVYFKPPQSALKRASQIDDSLYYHFYSTVEGLPELRNCISNKLKTENQINLSNKQNIIVTAGANMAFINAIMAITDPDDEIILLRPYYFNHEMAINMANCKPVIVDTDSNFQPDLNKIAKAITTKTKAIVTVSPNNPSGAVYPEATLKKINQLCKEKRIYHISDEAYEYFIYGKTRHFSVSSLPDSEEHTISLYSLSKAYGFASWRIGYMLIPEHLSLAVKKIQDTILICPARITQEAAIAAIKEGQNYTFSHLKQIKTVREELYTALQSINNIGTTADSTGAFYFFVKLNTELTGMQLVERLIKKHKIAVIPGETFGMNDGCYIRIAYGALDKKTSETGIQRLINGLTDIIR